MKSGDSGVEFASELTRSGHWDKHFKIFEIFSRSTFVRIPHAIAEKKRLFVREHEIICIPARIEKGWKPSSNFLLFFPVWKRLTRGRVYIKWSRDEWCPARVDRQDMPRLCLKNSIRSIQFNLQYRFLCQWRSSHSSDQCVRQIRSEIVRPKVISAPKFAPWWNLVDTRKWLIPGSCTGCWPNSITDFQANRSSTYLWGCTSPQPRSV